MGDEVAVSLLHTAGLITLGCVDQLIGLPLDPEIDKFIPERPAPGLVPAGQDENQTDCRIGRSQPENALRCLVWRQCPVPGQAAGFAS